MLINSPENKNFTEFHKNELKRIQKTDIEVSDENGTYSIKTYNDMISDLPARLLMLEQDINVEQMNEELDFFILLMKFPKIPDEITNQQFILAILCKIQQLGNEELLFKFSRFINNYYDDDFDDPPNELIVFSIQIISSATLPLQIIQEKTLYNFIIFLSSVYQQLEISIADDQDFYAYLSQFLNVSPQMNYALTYLFSTLAPNCTNNEALSYFPTLLELIYSTSLPLIIQSIQNEDDECSYNILLNITSTICGFASQSRSLSKKYFSSNASSIVLPLSELWEVNDNIIANIIDILRCVAREAIELFYVPNSTDQLQELYEIIQTCLDKGGNQVILSSIMEGSTEYTTESLLFLKSLIHINLTRQTTFLFEDQDDLCQIFRRILYFCADGKLTERYAAGGCLSKVIRFCPNFMLNFLIADGEVLAFLKMSPDDLDQFSDTADLAFIGIIADLLSLDDDKLSKDLIKALFVMSKRFDDMDHMHEFREECALYNIEEKVNYVTEKTKNESLYELGDSFVLAAFGTLPFSETDMPLHLS